MPGDIAHDNLMIAPATALTASSESSGFEAVNLSNWNVYESWKPSAAGTQTLDIDLGSLIDVDTFAIFGHDLNDYAGTIKLQWSNDGATGWTDLFSAVTPSDNTCVFETFTSVSKRYFRIVTTQTGSAAAIHIAFVGERMILEKGFRIGYVPPGLLDDAETIQNVSDNGLPLGRSNIAKPGKYTIPQTILSPSWVRSDWVPFLEHTKLYPFFFAWDLANYPNEVVFAWTNGKTIEKPKYSHANYMSAALKIMTKKEL